jgi:hypothetical protein
MACRVCGAVMKLVGWWRLTGGPRKDVYQCFVCRKYR